MSCCKLAGFEVCFPSTQEINNVTRSNPYYDFSAQESFWTYTIKVDTNENDLSHWDLAMCKPFLEQVKEEIEDCANISDFFQVEVKMGGGIFIDITDDLELLPEGDPSIDPVDDNNIPVLKIETVQEADNILYTYRITIKDSNYYNLAAEGGIVAIKEAGPPGTGFQIFNSYQALPDLPITCTGDNVILGPSIDCNEFVPPSRGIEL